MRVRWLSVLVLVAAMVIGPTAAAASVDLVGGQDRVQAPRIVDASAAVAAHFVEFAARSSTTFGHSYVQIGTIGSSGVSRRSVVFGFYPRTGADDALSVLSGTPGAIGFTRRDLAEAPSVRYRVTITAPDHHRLIGAVGHWRQTWRHFDLVRRNCNHLTGHVARGLGLAVPADAAQSPEAFVRELEALNDGRATLPRRRPSVAGSVRD